MDILIENVFSETREILEPAILGPNTIMELEGKRANKVSKKLGQKRANKVSKKLTQKQEEKVAKILARQLEKNAKKLHMSD